MLTLGSLFDGIGGWLLAAQHAGVKPLWRCEIDKFPRAVSEYHFPDVESYGDIRGVHGNEIAPVDIICAGSPCQNLSIAGNRKGLNGSESSLFYESVRVLYEMRRRTNGKYPRFFVWENVPGAFSSNHGEDFRAVLEEIGQAKIPMPKCGKWATAGMAEFQGCQIAWRVLDAQYWGVPQRRRRIFLVADFANGGCAGEVLFIEQGVSRDFEKSGTPWKRTAAGTENGTRSTSYCLQGSMIGRTEKNGPQGDGINKDVSFTLNTTDRHAVTTYAAQSYSEIKESDCGATLKSAGGVLGGAQKTMLKSSAYSFDSLSSNSMKSSNPKSGCRKVDVARTVDTTYPDPSKNQGGIAILEKDIDVYDMTHADEVMRKMNGEKVNTLNSRMGTGGNQVPVLHNMQRKTVRRLTPTECERLQGLPDDWTNIEINGKPSSDSRRYKAIGNGMAQPCADFVLAGIVRVMEEQKRK